MHHTAALAVVLLSLAADPASAATDEELVASLRAPVSLEDVAVDVADNELEISFSLREIGHVSLAVHAEDDGSGHGLVMVDSAIVAELGFVDGAIAWQESDFSELSPAQARVVVASLLQIWHADAVTVALLDGRDLKCSWAGKIAGSTLGLAVFSGCGLITKSPKCYGWGFGVGYGVAGYITGKCNGAQNA